MTDNPDKLLGEQSSVFSRGVSDTQLVLGDIQYPLILEVFRQMPFSEHSGIEQLPLVPLPILGFEQGHLMKYASRMFTADGAEHHRN
ncbi:hypothetical protein D3C85_1689490 [compost metagenome]